MFKVSDQGSGLMVTRHCGHSNDDGNRQLETSSLPHDHGGESRF